MSDTNNVFARELMDSFRQFQKLHWNKRNIEGLKPSETFLLFSIHKLAASNDNGIKVSDISRHLGVAPPSVTQLLRNMEARDYIQRKHDQNDRRIVRVSLGTKGKELTERINKEFYDSFEGLVEFLGYEDSRTLSMLMNRTYEYFLKRKDKYA